MNIQLYQLFWCESKGSLGCWQRLDGFSLMIASHLRVGWCLVLVRHTIYIQLVIYLNHHFYNWWPSWCRWRWRRCQTGQVGSPGYSKLWRRAFFLVFDVGLGQIERCRMDVLEGLQVSLFSGRPLEFRSRTPFWTQWRLGWLVSSDVQVLLITIELLVSQCFTCDFLMGDFQHGSFVPFPLGIWNHPLVLVTKLSIFHCWWLKTAEPTSLIPRFGWFTAVIGLPLFLHVGTMVWLSDFLSPQICWLESWILFWVKTIFGERAKCFTVSR